MTFLTLTTPRLTIRHLHTADAEAIAHYRSLPEVAAYQSWTQYPLEKASELILEMKTAAPEIKGQWFQFGIELNENKQLIGDIGFLNTDADNKSWIGFTLNSAYWNKGFANEAVSVVIEYYKDLGLTDIFASTDPMNISSKKLLEKLEFVIIENHPDDVIFQKKLLAPLS
jgi:RimJ/RimL family protein N-acetyltransferase